ncbi:MAG: class B sortase [Clostridiales bacterium]|nr:class B sortase [Clostridiales bacterium]
MKKNYPRIILIIALACAITSLAVFLHYAQIGEPHPQPQPPVIEPPAADMIPDAETEETSQDSDAVPVMLERFSELYEQNEDLVGWIRVPNTVIDYPIVYCSDNAYYLKHNFSKKQSAGGAPFLDSSADMLEKNQNLSLYAHYMKNGSMFTALHNYKDFEYYKAYPLFEFDSLYEESLYKIFSVFYMAGNHTDEYFYYYPTAHFTSDDAFMEHVNQLLTRSIFVTGIDVAAGDQLVLMTVCTYETDNLRLVVAGRKIRPGESIVVDTEKASINQEPLYPKKWYRKFGGEPVDFVEKYAKIN